jgi:hypothetical protein
VKPEPLLRVLAHPALDDAVERRRRADDIDEAFAVARQVERRR